MYGIVPKALPEAYHHGTSNAEERLQQVQQWRNNALIAHEPARQQMKQKIKSTLKPFSKGQKVWLEGRNIKLDYNKKISTKREGPFVITEVIGPVNYRLKLPNKWKIHDIFHATLLTPYQENGTHGPNYTQPPPNIVDNEPEWEVERIIRHKGTKNIQYEIKWKGYEETSWEPKDNLSNTQEILEDYWKRKKKITR